MTKRDISLKFILAYAVNERVIGPKNHLNALEEIASELLGNVPGLD